MPKDLNNNRPLRILMLVSAFPMPVRGGAQKQAYLLARILAEDGHTVIVVGRRFRLEQKEVEHINGVEVIRPSYGPGALRIFDLVYQPLLPFLLFSRRNDFDIVHVQSTKLAGLITLICSKILGKKILQKIPGVGFSAVFEFGKLFFGAIRRTIFRLSADAIVALSESSVQELKSAGYPETRIFRITNGVQTDNYTPRDVTSEKERLTIIFLGRLAATKGLLDLLDAWEIVVSVCGETAAGLKIFGQGPMESRVRKTIAVKSLNTSVKLCGHIDDVQSVLTTADILVLPSYEEGNSNSILEAMAAGLPIIGTTVGGTANLVGNAGRSLLHEPGDIRGLSEILLRLIRDRELRLETGLRMRERILKHFAITEIKDKYVRAYRLLIDGERDKIWDSSEYPPD